MTEGERVNAVVNAALGLAAGASVGDGEIELAIDLVDRVELAIAERSNKSRELPIDVKPADADVPS